MTTDRFSHLFFRVARIVALVTLVLSAIVCILPERPAKALIGPTGWASTTGFFQNAKPIPDEVRKSIVKSADATYWRSWTIESNATQGEIRSNPFKAPRVLLVPYGGFAGNPGVSLNLECVATREQMPIATARTNNQWSEALLYVPRHWCQGPVQVVGTTTSKIDFLAVGTPFSVSVQSYLKASVLGLLAPFAVAFAVIAGIMLLGGAVSLRLGVTRNPITGGFLLLGTLGLTLFFAYFASRTSGRVMGLAVELAAMATLWSVYRLRRAGPADASPLGTSWNAWKLPLALWIIGATFLLFLGAAVQNGGGPWALNARFAPVRWSADNQLPMYIAESLYRGRDLLTLPFGSWKVSDRPPLAYGLQAMLRTSTGFFALREDGAYMVSAFHQLFGLILNTIWIPALVFAGRWLRLDKRQIVALAAITTLTSFALFNSVYTWPKMLGGSFGLIALLTLLSTDDRLSLLRSRPGVAPIAVGAALSAFALLSHGGTAFGVIAMLVWLVALRGIPTVKALVAGAVIGVGILVPWALWQHFVQPPGNALLKFAFAGTFGFGEENMGLGATIARTYAALDLASWWHIKATALQVMILGEGNQCGIGEMAPVTTTFGGWRITDYMYLFPSLRFALLGVIPLAGALFTTKLFPATSIAMKQVRLAAWLVAIGLTSIAIDVALTLDCFIIHHQAYQSVLELYMGLFVALLLWRHWISRAILGASVGYAVVVWILDPILRADHVGTIAIAGLVFMTLVAVATYLVTDERDEGATVGFAA